MTDTFPVIAQAPGYNAALRSGVVAVELDGGPPRLRNDFLGGVSEVRVTWLCNRQLADQVEFFYLHTTQEGALPMLAKLIVDMAEPALYRCTIRPGTFGLTAQRGNAYTYGATLLVETPELAAGDGFAQAPNELGFGALPNPSLDVIFAPGDNLVVSGAIVDNGSDPPINLNGTYEVSSVPNGFTVALVSPNLVNPDWDVLATYIGGASGIMPGTKVIKVPT